MPYFCILIMAVSVVICVMAIKSGSNHWATFFDSLPDPS